MLGRVSNIIAVVLVSITLTQQAAANMTGSASQNFNPSANASDLNTVRTADTLGRGIYSLGLSIHGAVNSLPYYSDAGESTASRGKINDTITSASLGLAAGVLDNLDLELVLPAVLFQSVSNQDERHGQFAKQGITGATVAAKYGFLRGQTLNLALVTSVDFNFTEANPYDGAQRLNGYNFELVATSHLSLFTVSANIGYRLREPQEIERDREVSSPSDDQLLASAGLSIPTGVSNMDVITEVYGSAPFNKQFEANSRHSTKAEALTGIRKTDSNKIYQFGMGTELRHGSATADWRLYAGLHYLFGVSKDERPETIVEPQVDHTEVVPNFLESDIDLLQKPDEVIVIDDILFKFNSDQIKDTDVARKQLADLVKSLRKGDGFAKLIIEGHTCSIGTTRFNQKLSARRALKIKSLLTREYVFSSARIRAKGMGESVPVATNNTEAGRERNRRVEFKIFRKSSTDTELSFRGGSK